MFSCVGYSVSYNQTKQKPHAEIGKAKQAYGPMAPGLQKLWAISKKYGPCQQWDGPEVQEKYWCFSKAIHVTFFGGGGHYSRAKVQKINKHGHQRKNFVWRLSPRRGLGTKISAHDRSSKIKVDAVINILFFIYHNSRNYTETIVLAFVSIL